VNEVEIRHGDSETSRGHGTAFPVAPGLWATNFHVIRPTVLEEDYRAELLTDAGTFPAQVVDFDVVTDLALLAVPGTELQLPLASVEPKEGVPVYSLGFPTDLGRSIVDGTWNGALPESLGRLIHFSGNINPGMSGGPTVTLDGDVVGINVATSGDGMGYVVPVEHLQALIASERPTTGLRDEVTRQVMAWQERFTAAILADPPESETLGPWRVPGRLAPFGECWRDETINKDTWRGTDFSCSWWREEVPLEEGLGSGSIISRYRRVESKTATGRLFEKIYADQDFQTTFYGKRKDVGAFECHEDFVSAGQITLRATFCLRPHRAFPGLYDGTFHAKAMDVELDGLDAEFSVWGVTRENAVRLAAYWFAAFDKAEVAE